MRHDILLKVLDWTIVGCAAFVAVTSVILGEWKVALWAALAGVFKLEATVCDSLFSSAERDNRTLRRCLADRISGEFRPPEG